MNPPNLSQPPLNDYQTATMMARFATAKDVIHRIAYRDGVFFCEIFLPGTLDWQRAG